MKKIILTLILCFITYSVQAETVKFITGKPPAATADYVPAKAYLCLSDTEGAGTTFKVGIYNSEGALISNGTSSEQTWSSGGPKWSTAMTFTSAAALTATSTYYIGITANGTIYFESTGSGWLHSTEASTWANLASTITLPGTGEVAVPTLGVYITNAADDVLIGNNSCDSGNNSGLTTGSTYYKDSGYTCATLE